MIEDSCRIHKGYSEYPIWLILSNFLLKSKLKPLEISFFLLKQAYLIKETNFIAPYGKNWFQKCYIKKKNSTWKHWDLPSYSILLW